MTDTVAPTPSPSPAATSASPAGLAWTAWRSAVELFVLCGFAFGQTVLSTMGTDPSAFLGRAARPLTIVLFAVAVTFGPAIALFAGEVLVARISRRAARGAHVVFVAALGALLVLQIARAVGAPTVAALAIAGVAGAGFAWSRERSSRTRMWLVAAGPAPCLFAGLFVFASPVTDAVLVDAPPPPPSAADIVRDEAPLAPIVVVVFDELPTATLLDGKGAIDAELFPAFADLASDSAWYRNHATIDQITDSAVPAILTGSLREGGAKPATASAYPDSIFRLLGDAYDLHVSESYTQLCAESFGCDPPATRSQPAVLGDLLDVAGTVYWRVLAASENSEVVWVPGSNGIQAVPQFRSFVEQLGASGDRPRLDVIHVALPHRPWYLYPSGHVYDAPGDPAGGAGLGRWRDAAAATWGRQQHLLQVQYADAQLGGLLEELRRSGVYDETVVAVVADHGTAFDPGQPQRDANAVNFDEILYTPMLLKPPHGDEPVIVDDPVSTIDLVPSLAEMVGVDIPWNLDGVPFSARAGESLETRRSRDRFGAWSEFSATDGFERLLGAGPWPLAGRGRWRPYALGEHAELIGEEVTNYGTYPEAGSVRLRWGRGHTTQPAAGRGAYVEGEISADTTIGMDDLADDVGEVVIALDGVVVAVVPVSEAGGPSFAAVLPDWLEPATATVTVHAVFAPGADLWLVPLGVR